MARAAYAQSPDPVVSLVSVLTGRYPSAIPVCGSIRRGPSSTLDEPWCHQLPSEADSLPEVLGLYGYRSALVHSLGPVPGLAEGFELVLPLDRGPTPWAELSPALEDWWSRDPDAPRLLVIQLADLDLPARPELLTSVEHSPQDWAGLVDRAAHTTGAATPQRLPNLRPPCTPLVGQQAAEPAVWDATVGGEIFHEDLRESLLALYTQEAARVGQALHDQLAALPATRPRHTVLAGLHGLSIGELGGTLADERELLWSDRVADRTVHVPLVFAEGGADAPRLIEQPVELVDLLPTLLARTEAQPPHGLPGEDLLAPGWREDPDQAVAYVEYGDMLALRHGDRLLSMRAMVHNISSLDPYLSEVLACPGLVGGFALHDPVADPFQRVDLLEAEPVAAERLEALLIERRTGPGGPAAALSEPDALLRLRLTRAEGYW